MCDNSLHHAVILSYIIRNKLPMLLSLTVYSSNTLVRQIVNDKDNGIITLLQSNEYDYSRI